MNDQAHAIGIDLGGTLTKIALVAADGAIIAGRRLPTRPGWTPEACFEEIRATVQDLSRAAGLSYPPEAGCGIGIPGVVDARTGTLAFSGPLGWRNTETGRIATDALGCPVAVDTDVNAGALADLYLGAGRNSSDMLYISWGTGIGAGIVVSRKLYHTRGGAMCNIGHMLADPESTRQCYCGCYGCLEVEAGGKAMVDQARQKIAAAESALSEGEITPEAIACAAAGGDAIARAILDRSARLMARVLGSVLALLNPDTVVFGGGVSRCFPVIQETFDRELRARTPSFSAGLTRVHTSDFGENAGVLGAAMLALGDPACR